MAQPAPLHDANNTASIDHEAAPGTSDSASGSVNTLPLRQAMQRQQHPRTETRIVDITERFTSACSALKVGQLVKDEYFTLFESIGALEIMDPKMDSGFLQPGETLEDAYDTLAPLLPEEVIGIMDQLLCYEMAWHTGYPLSQTLFTSVYIDKLLWPEPRTVAEAQFFRGEIPDVKRPGALLEVLRVYCLGVVKCCDFVIGKIQTRDYYEEEDFCTHVYNRELFPRVPMDVFMRELDVGIELMEDLEISDVLRTAIITRLDFRKSFLAALDLDCLLEAQDKHWPSTLASLTTINTTQQLGKTVPGSFSTKIQRRLTSTVPPRPIVELSFADALTKLTQLCNDCSYATRFAALPTDPLEMESFLWAYASRTPSPLPYSRSYFSNIVFHPDVLKSISLPQSDVETCVFPTGSPVTDPLNWTMSPPLNPSMPKNPRLELASLIDEFIAQVGTPYMDYWTALTQNPCRKRRLLTHVIKIWDTLQIDARSIDEDLAGTCARLNVPDMQHRVLKNPLSTWTEVKKLSMVSKIVLLGFEQDIYLPEEYGALYYFLSHVSARYVALLQETVEFFIAEMLYLRRIGNTAQAAQVEEQRRHVESKWHYGLGVFHLSTALSEFYVQGMYLGIVPLPRRYPSKGADEEKQEALRYELRMRPFLTLTPALVPPFAEFHTATHPFGAYDHPASGTFATASESTESANSRPDSESETTQTRAYADPETQNHIFNSITSNINAAKKAFAYYRSLGPEAAKSEGMKEFWEKDVKGLLASCVALGVAVVGVKGAVEMAGPTRPRGELGMRIEVPEGSLGLEIKGEKERGKRYSEGWVVGRVVKI